jgi:ABC-type transport system involved in Fe-S cluster assembly fused permease/ATPase subunit
VFEALKKVTVGKTSMSIAHRLSTIVDNDEIYVFSDGEIIEQGTYE